MNKTNEQNAGSGSSKPSFQSQNLGPNKVASTETPPKTTPEIKTNLKPDSEPDVKPESSLIVPDVVHQVTAKPVESKPLLQKQS